MKQEKNIRQGFASRIRSRRDGFEETQLRIRAEIRAERRRARFWLLARPLAAAAALLVISSGTFIVGRQVVASRALPPLCPHAANVKPHVPVTRVVLQIREIMKHDRICCCSPRYSGSLRSEIPN
jgi:hypothetical protein